MSNQRFKYYHGGRTLLSSGKEIFSSRVTGRTSVVSRDAAVAAAACTNFATLEEHANQCEFLSRASEKDPSVWKSTLMQAVEGGLLLTMSEVHDRLANGLLDLPRPRTLGMIGIPTRDRPELLHRLLEGLTANLRRYQREVEILVVDDSESADMQTANRRVIRLFTHDASVKIRYGNRETRSLFAAQLAKESGVHEEVVSFALRGSPGYPVSIGSARNALLLESSGHCLLYVDDDIECRMTPIPDSTDELVFQGNAFATWFFGSRDEVEGWQFAAKDLLGLHERVLNFARNHVMGEAADFARIDLSTVSTGLLRRIEKGNAGVAVSAMGIIGDAALDDPLSYFLLGDETLSRLTQTEDLYRAAMKNRTVLRGPGSTCIFDQAHCLSYCMGVDNSDLLPPFMPVSRGEELVFSSIVSKCLPGALYGVVPWAILHRPSQNREFENDASVLRAGRFMAGETLAFLIGSESARGASRAELMLSLGSRLGELRFQAESDFQKHIRQALEPLLVSWMRSLDAIVQDRPKSSEFWVNDVKRVNAAILRALNERDHSVPSDLEQQWGATEGRLRFRRLVEQYSSLLQAWPKMVDAAHALHGRGTTICLPETATGTLN